jgi:hypothetical protein
MNTPSIQGAGRGPEMSDVKVVAFYDPASGVIVHVHTIAVFKGADPVSDGDAIERATTHASIAGRAVSTLKIKLSNNLEHGVRRHSIDLKTGDFVRVPTPAERRPK